MPLDDDDTALLDACRASDGGEPERQDVRDAAADAEKLPQSQAYAARYLSLSG